MNRLTDAMIEYVTRERIEDLFWLLIGATLGYLAHAAGVAVPFV